MKKILYLGITLLLASCGSGRYLNTYTTEELSLNLTKVTDETQATILSGYQETNLYNSDKNIGGYIKNKHTKFAWLSDRHLDISPNGDKLVYITSGENNTDNNIIVRSIQGAGMPTQRVSNKSIGDVCWSNDSRIYFSDYAVGEYYSDYSSVIRSIHSDSGSLISNHTNGNIKDSDVVTSYDGNYVYFTRYNKNTGNSIWRLDITNNTLTTCSSGCSPCPIPGTNDAYYCVRSSESGRSEIWYVDFVKGIETIILTDENTGFAQPRLSPNGKYIICEGNSKSNISKKNNVDIFVAKTDGSNLIQLTYHPSTDVCPIWSKDGKSIYFLSNRANEKELFNVWKMDINL